MGDSGSTGFLSTRTALSSNPSYNLGTPSQLTPNTRSEAEAALTANSAAQTDSAAPTTPLPDAAARFEATYALAGRGRGFMTANTDGGGAENPNGAASAVDEAKLAYRRPPNPTRTGSSNYAEALRASAEPGTMLPEAIIPEKGVVPLKTGVGEGQAEAVKRVRPTGLSLGDLGRKQSWSTQDFKHIHSERLMAKGEGDAGYSSAAEER